MTRLKVTDGDLLVLMVPDDLSSEKKTEYCKSIVKWLQSKGLNNVTALVANAGDTYTFQVLSVNDVAEEALLGGKNE